MVLSKPECTCTNIALGYTPKGFRVQFLEFLFYFIVKIYLFQREQESVCEWGEEQRERLFKQAPCWVESLWQGSITWPMRSWLKATPRVSCLNDRATQVPHIFEFLKDNTVILFFKVVVQMCAPISNTSRYYTCIFFRTIFQTFYSWP